MDFDEKRPLNRLKKNILHIYYIYSFFWGGNPWFLNFGTWLVLYRTVLAEDKAVVGLVFLLSPVLLNYAFHFFSFSFPPSCSMFSKRISCLIDLKISCMMLRSLTCQDEGRRQCHLIKGLDSVSRGGLEPLIFWFVKPLTHFSNPN